LAHLSRGYRLALQGAQLSPTYVGHWGVAGWGMQVGGMLLATLVLVFYGSLGGLLHVETAWAELLGGWSIALAYY
jgi:hypothetical protein